jgi:transglutaminase-like putative cysteine protease
MERSPLMNTSQLQPYLQACPVIDFNEPSVLRQAQELSAGLNTDLDIARACFEFVRDEIKHTFDYQLNTITLTASQVLKHGTGFCYAKSHLLAALLRANNIPCGLCYQRLTISNDVAPFCLHGLNAVYLPDIGWYKIDARGNKEGVNAQFCPPQEKLAFEIKTEGEANLPEIWHEPMPTVTKALNIHGSLNAMIKNLPDITL